MQHTTNFFSTSYRVEEQIFIDDSNLLVCATQMTICFLTSFPCSKADMTTWGGLALACCSPGASAKNMLIVSANPF